MSHQATRTPSEHPGGGGAIGLTRAHRRLLLALAAALLAPSSLHAADLAVPERVIYGYEDGTRFRVPHGVALDPARGELIVANTGEHRIEIFSLSGRSLARFVHQVKLPDGSTAPGLPHAVAVLPTGRIAITDNLVPNVDIVDRRGRTVFTVSIPSSAKGSPQALAVTPQGGLLVAGPPGDDRVYRYDAGLHLTATWGVRGEQPGQLNAISGLAFLADGRIGVICVQTKLAVQIFSADGVYQTGFGIHDIGHGNFSVPSGIAATADGRIWVADEVRQVIQVFDRDGTFLAMLGGFGVAAGDLNYPSALTGDGTNRLAVAERELGRVQILIANRGGEDSGRNIP
ncbi:MAG TPA: NHL repeat-containing protein [Candidatus Binatia bacterium]|nr:NHL repeat-containing protein [Candidatus Binatia bacterium]